MKSKKFTAAEKHFLGKEQKYRNEIKQLNKSLIESREAHTEAIVVIHKQRREIEKLLIKLEEAEARAEGRDPELEHLVKSMSRFAKLIR